MNFLTAFNRVRISRAVVSILVLTLIQTLGGPILTPNLATPQAKAYSNTYTAGQSGVIEIPAGVTSITITLRGGAGGVGGTDGSPGGLPTQIGSVSGTITVTPGNYLQYGVGNNGTNGTNNASNGGGGAGGTNPLDANYNGGIGGGALDYGSSGGGGGGGAASLLRINGLTIVAAGGGGGGGDNNCMAAIDPYAFGATPAAAARASSGTAGAKGIGYDDDTVTTHDGSGAGGGGGGAVGGYGGDMPKDCSEWRGHSGYAGTNGTASISGLTGTSVQYSDGPTFTITYELNAITTYTASTTTPTFGSAVTLTATVTTGATGTVTFKDASNNVLCTTGTLSSGTASCSWTPSARATYSISAFYSGDGSYPASNSSSATLTVSLPLLFSETDTALTFTTAKYAWAPDSNELDVTSAITMQAWVYQTSTIAGAWNMVVNKENSYELGTLGSLWYFALRGSGGWYGVNTGITTRLNEWQHVALTRATGSETAKFYVNGQEVWSGTADGAGAGNITNSNLPFTIGGRSSDGVNFTSPFLGSIDEVRVFRSARTQPEIAADMHTYGPINTSDLALYYDFNEGSGTTLYNRVSGSSSTSDLTIVGSPVWNSDVISTQTAGSPYTTRTFKRSYLTAAGGWNVPAGVTKVSALVVGGGGGGGGTGDRGWSGGGGAGGRVISQSTLDLNSDSSVIIKIGQGGQGGSASAQAVDSDFAQSGQSSIFGNLIAPGGGAGGHALVSSVGASASTYSSEDRAAPKNGGGGGAQAKAFNGAYVDSSTVKGGNGVGSGTAALQAAGGGAGSLGSGENASSVAGGAGGAGGAGVSSSISGASLTYGGGGGGGKRENSGSAGVGNDGGGNGGLATFGGAGINNRGGGGGGAGGVGEVGGSGGSGIIIIRWLTATAPTFTAPVAVDTTTAGLQHTFQISGAAISPLTRSFIWQSSSDTGTSWINIQASASNSLTTSTLETTTSGARYLYRAIVTDSDIYGLSITDTSTAFYLVINPRITISGISFSLTQKYGESQTATFDFAFGTETRTATFSPGGQSGISWSDISSDSATITLASGLNVGTYYETITVTDSVTAQTIQMLTFTVTQADSITVSALDITTTYAPNTPVPGSYSITGLQNNESATATLNYQEGEVGSSTPTPPTDAGTYSVSPSSFTLLNGADIANYAGVIYESATVVIDRAPQVRLTIGQYNAFRGISTYPVNVYGGSDIGAITVSVIDSSTSGCLLVSERALTAANVGNCTIQVVKAGTRNYLTETATATFYWIEWVANNTVQALPGANTTPLTGGNSVEKSEVVVTANSFTNTSGDGITSSSVGNTIRILITGYEGLDPLDIDVIFRPYQYVEVISDLTSTYIQVVIPVGSITGYIAINGGRRGVSHTPEFTILP